MMVEHDGLTFSVVVSVSRGRPAAGPTMACAGGYPAEPDECEIEAAGITSEGGVTFTIDTDELGDDLIEKIQAQAFEEAQEAEECGKEEAAEARAEARREGDCN